MARPLSGIRVLDLTAALSGPYAAMYLGDLGAEVIKIEPPEGEIFRNMGPYHVGEWSVYYVGVNRNKMSVALNLKSPDGLEALYGLVKVADVVLDNFRPGVVQRLKIDHQTLSALNPRIITCSITGYGSQSSYRDRTAFDLCVQAASGMISVTGTEDGQQVKVGTPIGDLTAGQNAVIGILAALQERHVSGTGQHVDISMFDSQLSLLCYWMAWYSASGVLPRPLGTAHLGIEPHGAYRTKDGQIAMVIGTEKFWRDLCEVLGVPDMATEPRFCTVKARQTNRVELRRIMEEIMGARTNAEWMELMVEAGIPAAPVNDLAQALAEPPTAERNMLVKLDQPRWGKARVVGNPVKFSRTKAEEFAPVAAIGEHTRDVLRGLLGYSNRRIDRMIAAGAAIQFEAPVAG